MRQKLTFLTINAVGGITVLASYAYGAQQYADAVPALWGDIPQWMMGFYTINMLLAAAGYLMMFFYVLKSLPEDCRTDNGGLLFERLNTLSAVILFCSALWMPLSFAVLTAPNMDLWLCIRAVLLATGIAALVFAHQIAKYAEDRGVLFTLALCAYAFFCVQTALLDALIWPYYFPL